MFVNGKAIPESPPFHAESHWAMLEVTSALADGDNLIAVCLPQALFDYRVYLSGEAPHIYPAMGQRLNAMWADFSDWTSWSRGQAVRRGAQMIRQVDPDRPITLMSPDVYMGPIKEVAEDFGGIFHDTGGMAGSWGDMHPIMVQSMGLPSDCEPGSGAVDLDDFKRFMGRWLTEGTQGIDYFMHIGDILWKPAVKDYFTQTLPPLAPDRQVPRAAGGTGGDVQRPQSAALRLSLEQQRSAARSDPAQPLLGIDLQPGGRLSPRRRAGAGLRARQGGPLPRHSRRQHRDHGPRGGRQIEAWVRRGGVFITFHQTGRHTSLTPDAWPISKLTGYAVTGIDQLSPNGDGMPSRRLHMAEGQKVFHSDVPSWRYAENGAGLSLKKIDPACEDLLLWQDGSVAAGVRRLGKGMVFHLGANSLVLPFQVLEWLHVKKMPIASSDKAITTRHYVSNNGLYDIWLMWNTKGEPATSTFTFREGCRPASLRDVNTGKAVAFESDGQGARLAQMALTAWETHGLPQSRAGGSPRAPADWFALQRQWWSGTADPGPPIPAFRSKVCLDLTEDWAYKILGRRRPASAGRGRHPGRPGAGRFVLAADADWHLQRAGQCRRPSCRLSQDVPRARGLEPGARAVCLPTATCVGAWRRYLDGKPLEARNGPDDDLGGVLKPGSTHCLAIEIWGPDMPAGTPAPIFISYRPNPAAVSR